MKNVLISEKDYQKLLQIQEQFEALEPFSPELQHSQKQQDELIALRQENAELSRNNQALQAQLESLLEQFRLAQKKRFGSSSEQSNYLQQSFFDEAEIYRDELVEEPTAEVVEEVVVRKRKKKGPNQKERIPDKTGNGAETSHSRGRT
ncbi:hypothetical protein HCH52_12135 [Oscillospiraceae bacterium HV4-5-C5C]|nr:hypothetical protein [Oscillospiraceae bacterium HV4-5-C5C]